MRLFLPLFLLWAAPGAPSGAPHSVTVSTLWGSGPSDGAAAGGPPAAAAPFISPTFIAAGPGNTLYVSDPGAGAVRVLYANGTLSSLLGGGGGAVRRAGGAPPPPAGAPPH